MLEVFENLKIRVLVSLVSLGTEAPTCGNKSPGVLGGVHRYRRRTGHQASSFTVPGLKMSVMNLCLPVLSNCLCTTLLHRDLQGQDSVPWRGVTGGPHAGIGTLLTVP